MKSSTLKRIGGLLLASAMLFGCGINDDGSDDNTQDDSGVVDDNTGGDDSGITDDDVILYGASGVDEDGEYTIEEMMAYAIQDEYIARSEYELIIDEYGQVRPFTNIIKAEENHIEALEVLFENYDYDLPEDLSADHVVLPTSLLEAYETGVEAEIANIAMYEVFLAQELPEDVRLVFENLQNASYNHLGSFQYNFERQGG